MAVNGVHSMGNGKLLIYGQGPNILHVFGPPYTSCDQLKIIIEGDITWETKRKQGTQIWEHIGYLNRKKVAVITDVMHPNMPLWVRRIEVFDDNLVLNCSWPDNSEFINENKDYLNKQVWCRRVRAHEGSPLFGFYPHYYLSASPIFHLFQTMGNIRALAGDIVRLQVSSGISEIRIIGGPTFPENREWEECTKTVSFEDIVKASGNSSSKLFSRISLDIAANTPTDLAKEIKVIAEDVATLIATQQGQEGGVVAGYPFQLAYVRDQYGVSRGLLAMGLFEEAERMLTFRFKKWKHFGNLSNAEMIGGEGIRHKHENDDVEITAYTILQAFEFAEITGLEGRLHEWFPMLEWCFEAQLPHLVGGMLPFNGDETYVAGGFLRRHQLNDGSSEATLLFIESGRRLLKFAAAFRLWSEQKTHSYRLVLQYTIKMYLENFYKEDKLIVNNPKRLDGGLLLPKYRHGVCMTCAEGSNTWFGWTERVESNFYVCPGCRNKIIQNSFEPESVSIPSVALLPPFINSSVIPYKLLYSQAETLLAEFREVMESKEIASSKRFVGYDMGLMLHFLSCIKHPATREFMRFVLDSRDSASSWPERYIGRKHDGCMARPWESAINLSAVLHCLK